MAMKIRDQYWSMESSRKRDVNVAVLALGSKRERWPIRVIVLYFVRIPNLRTNPVNLYIRRTHQFELDIPMNGSKLH